MNFPDDIPALELELSRARGMVDEDETALARSSAPDVDRIFLGTTKKLCSDLEQRLHLAKAERAHELVRLRLHGVRLTNGTIPLRLLTKLLGPFNGALERAAWRVWDVAGDSRRVSDDFVHQVDLRLAATMTGSTELVLLGNTAPDLSGVSALETALRDLFDLLASDSDALADRVHAMGIQAAKSLSEFLNALEREHVAADLEWCAPDRTLEWRGTPTEITRTRALLDEIGQPAVEKFCAPCTVNMLSIRNRLEVQLSDTGEKLRLGYHRLLAEEVHQLRLGDMQLFEIEKTVYPFAASRRKRDAYRLVSIRQAE